MREFVKRNRKKIVYGLLVFLLSASVLGGFLDTVNAVHASNHCPPGYTYRAEDNRNYCTADSDIFQNKYTLEEAWAAYNRGRDVTQAITDPVGTATRWAIDGVLKDIAFVLLKVTGVILWMAGTMFNAAISISIVHMKSFVDGTTVINEAWTVIRDLVNMAFIFVLLYIAISTILGMGKDIKKTLVGLIIAALLINFSLFFTKIVIDASNIVALQFYSAIIGADEIANQRGENDLGDKIKRGTDRGLSNVFSQAVGISGTFNPRASAGSIEASQFGEGFDASKLTDGNNFATIGIIGSLFLLIMAFVFFVGAFLFITRFVILILLMVASPIAFVGLMLPQFQKAGRKWWQTLLDQAFFAPAFMILMYLVALIVTSSGFKQMSAGENLSNAFIGQGSIVIVLNFVIVIVLALAAITISKSMMGGVSSGAVNWATKAGGKLSFGVAGAIGRQTVGRAAYATTQSTGFQKFSRIVPFGRQLYGGIKGVSTASFDARGSALGTMAAGQGIQLGNVGRKKGFGEYTEEKSKKKQQFNKDTEKGREAIAKAADARLREEAENKFGKENSIKTIGLFKNSAGAWKIKNPYSDKAIGSFVPKASQKKVAKIINDFEKGEKTIQELREEVYKVVKKDFKGGSAMEKDMELMNEKRRKQQEEERLYDPYTARLRRGSEGLRNVGGGVGTAYGWMRDNKLIGGADQDAAEKIRKWKHMTKQEQLLSELKTELEKNTKAEERKDAKPFEKPEKPKDESSDNE